MSKSVLITGCTEGTIGNSLALEFANRGWRVYATARKTSSMGNLANSEHITTLAFDITNRDTVIAARDRIAHETGRKLDILYHNAGHRSLAMAIDSDPNSDAYVDVNDAKLFETNVTAVMASTRIFAPLVIAARGTIAFSGSVAGHVPQPSEGAYGATKAALEAYSRTLRIEMKPLGVHVVYVMTAGVKTGMSTQRLESPETSLYKSINGKINEAWEDLEENNMTPAEYSAFFVERVSRVNPPEVVWQGYGWWKVWLIESLSLQWLYPRVLAPRFGLDKALL